MIDSDEGLLPSHYLNQYWNFVNWTLGNKLQWNFNQNWYICIQEIALDYFILKNGQNLSRSQYADFDGNAILCKPSIQPKGRNDQSMHIKGLPTDRCCLVSQPEPATYLTSVMKPPPCLDLYFTVSLRSCIWTGKRWSVSCNHSTWNE